MVAFQRVSEDGIDASILSSEQVAIIGYGHLGRSIAQNLRDSGLSVLVGSRSDDSAERAREDGFSVHSVEDALSEASVVWFLLPDEVIPSYLDASAEVRPRDGSLVCVSSGYPLAYDLVQVPEALDVVMIAPRMIGSEVRRRFEAGDGFYCFVSVEQDASGKAENRLRALAKCAGALRVGAYVLPAKTEAALDLFIEQTVGPYLGASVINAFEVGTRAGLPAEALALEMYVSGEMSQTWRLFSELGFFRGVRSHGHSASFGGFIRMSEIDMDAMKDSFASILDDIQSGKFATRFQQELAEGSPLLGVIDAMTAGGDPMTEAEEAIRRGGPESA